MEWLKLEWAQHGAYAVVVFWFILSALLNMMIRRKSPEEWVAFAEARPRWAAVIHIIRAAGFDPAKVLTAIVQLVTAKAPQKLPIAIASTIVEVAQDGNVKIQTDGKIILKTEDKESPK